MYWHGTCQYATPDGETDAPIHTFLCVHISIMQILWSCLIEDKAEADKAVTLRQEVVMIDGRAMFGISCSPMQYTRGRVSVWHAVIIVIVCIAEETPTGTRYRPLFPVRSFCRPTLNPLSECAFTLSSFDCSRCLLSGDTDAQTMSDALSRLLAFIKLSTIVSCPLYGKEAISLRHTVPV